MSESALFSWLLWIGVGAWSGALIAALTGSGSTPRHAGCRLAAPRLVSH